MKLSHKYFKWHIDNLPNEFIKAKVEDTIIEAIHWVEANVKYENKSVEFVQCIFPYADGKFYFILRTTKID